jgi:hypothetical protein
LLDSGGLSGTVGFTLDAGNLLDGGNPSLQLLAGSAFQSNWDTPAELVMSGLTPGYYDLYIASYHPNLGGGRSLFSTLNTTTTVGTQIADNGGPDGNSQAWEQGVNYVLFHNMVPNPANNKITVTMVGDSGDNFTRAYLSGFQLVRHEESTIFTAKDILSFGLPDNSLPGNSAVIAAPDIAWAVPAGTDVTNLAPTYTVSPLATGNPVSGTSLDFTNHVAYTVTAEDGSTQVYTVTVIPISNINWKRGDANTDGTADISDAIMVLSYLYLGETALLCLDAADANDDGELDISDPIELLFHLFQGVQPLPAPFPGCGIDPTIDGLDCEAYTYTGCP